MLITLMAIFDSKYFVIFYLKTLLKKKYPFQTYFSIQLLDIVRNTHLKFMTKCKIELLLPFERKTSSEEGMVFDHSLFNFL